MPKFLRRTSNRYSKLGKRRKKKQVWRKPTGRDNKMREKRKGYPAVVKIGYKKSEHKSFSIIKNIEDLKKIQNNESVILGKIGKKKKIEILKKAKEMKIKIYKINIEKFLKENEKKNKKEKVEEVKDKKQIKTKDKLKEKKK